MFVLTSQNAAPWLYLAVRGCSCQDDLVIEALCFHLVSDARKQPDASLEQLLSPRQLMQSRLNMIGLGSSQPFLAEVIEPSRMAP